MRLLQIPLWNEVCVWLFMKTRSLLMQILLKCFVFVNINAALEERDSIARQARRHLLERISILC